MLPPQTVQQTAGNGSVFLLTRRLCRLLLAVFNLTEGIDVAEMERKVEQYRLANGESIIRNEARRWGASTAGRGGVFSMAGRALGCQSQPKLPGGGPCSSSMACHRGSPGRTHLTTAHCQHAAELKSCGARRPLGRRAPARRGSVAQRQPLLRARMRSRTRCAVGGQGCLRLAVCSSCGWKQGVFNRRVTVNKHKHTLRVPALQGMEYTAAMPEAAAAAVLGM